MGHALRGDLTKLPSIAEIAECLAAAPTDIPWSREGRARQLIRSYLILRGARWSPADKEARRLVANGRSEARIAMAAGWDHNDPSSWWETRSCEICDRPYMPRRENQAFCSRLCKWRAKNLAEKPTILRRCSMCSNPFECPRHSPMRFCGATCRKEATKARDRAKTAEGREGRICVHRFCGNPIPEDLRANAKFCSKACMQSEWYLRNSEDRKHHASGPYGKPNGNGAVPNGHDHPKGEFTGRSCPENQDLTGTPFGALSEAARPGARTPDRA